MSSQATPKRKNTDESNDSEDPAEWQYLYDNNDQHQNMFSILDSFSDFSQLLQVKPRIKKIRGNIPSRVPAHIDREIEKLKSLYKKRIDGLSRKWHDKHIIKTRDKAAFVIGVANLYLTALLIGFRPQYIAWCYTLELITLMPWRFYTYRRKQYHYFIADLCYFTNVMLVIFLWIFPDSVHLLIGTFCLSYGSLAMAILAWRNSLVFHSVDKVTSVFIHMEPEIVLHTLLHIVPKDWRNSKYPAFTQLESLPFIYSIKIFTIYYLIWQSLYYFFIQVRKREKIAAGVPTSFTYLRRSYSRTWIGKFVLGLPEPLQPYCFMFIQYLFGLGAMLPTPIWYNNVYWSSAFLIFVLTWSVYNGASYYIEIFQPKFEKELAEMRKELEAFASGERSGPTSPNLDPLTMPTPPPLESSSRNTSDGSLISNSNTIFHSKT